MINRIKSALNKAGIVRWRINESVEESAELFFVKHDTDTRRIKDIHRYTVTVFRAGEKQVGATEAIIIPSMTDSQIGSCLADAYYAAGFAMNPDYAAPSPEVSDTVKKTGALAEAPLAESAAIMADAAFRADTNEHSFINSLEVFVHRYYKRVISSEGTDVSYTDAVCKGEYVVQCLKPEDVEIFNEFEYGELNAEALTAQVSADLAYVYDRAKAKSILKSGKYDVILSGENLAQIMMYYAEKSSANMIYPKYSTWKTGDNVQGDVSGDAIDISFAATAPFSPDGIRMNGIDVIKAGKLSAIHGSTQYCRYLGIEPTGFYSKTVCRNAGSISFEDMKKKPCLWPVVFSDFQMDSFSGHFGGEIRLAYLIDGESVTPVTGGSVNGSIIEAQQDMRFSTERYVSASYEGPFAAEFKGVSVAGTAD